MTRAVDLLVYENRFISNISSIALISFMLSIFLATFASMSGLDDPKYSGHPISLTIGITLGVVLILGLLAMVMATWKVLQKKNETEDCGLFLVIVWAIPYVGIAVYLGGKNIIALLKK